MTFKIKKTLILYLLIISSAAGNVLAAENVDSFLDYVKNDLNKNTTNINQTEPQNITEKQQAPNNINPDNIDLSEYMEGLQRVIKLHWDPPRDYRPKRIIVLFKILEDGSIIVPRLYQKSNVQAADEAALRAVSSVKKYKPLPYGLNAKSIDVQFTFTSSVINTYSTFDSLVNTKK